MDENTKIACINSTATIVSAMVNANFISGGHEGVLKAIGEVGAAIALAGEVTVVFPDGGSEPAATYEPAVSVRKSLASKDHIISMIDGKPYKTLRRHLASNGLTPAEYRARYGLKPDYPIVAESYSTRRSEMAKRIGLGRKPRKVAKDDGPTAA